jgi:hypothetical protein
LREEYPRFFRVLDTHRNADEVRKAYIADLWALRGRAPDAEDLDALARDSGFTRWLSAALGQPGRIVPDWQWAVTLGWIRKGYFRMKPLELARALNERTGLKLSAEAWRKRIARMKLENTLKLGRPENPNSLPPG